MAFEEGDDGESSHTFKGNFNQLASFEIKVRNKNRFLMGLLFFYGFRAFS